MYDLSLRAWDLSSINAIKEYLDINNDYHELYIAIKLLKSATDLIEGQLIRQDVIQGGYCNRRFLATTFTLANYTGHGYEDLLLRQYPINSVSAIVINDTTEYPSGASTLADLGFYVDNDIVGNLKFVSRWTEGNPNNIQITYNAGYTTIPFDIEIAALGLVALKWQRRGKELLKSEKIGQYAYTMADLNEKNPFGDEIILNTLNRYRRDEL